MAFGAGSKLVCARVLRVYTKPNPPFSVPPQCHSFEEPTNRRKRWWVGLRARLSGHLFQEKLNWRQHLGLDWSDENVPYFAVNHLPIFVPRKISWSLVRERRVGGLGPWRSGLLQSLFAPLSFEFIRSPTHHFPCRRSAIRSKNRRIGAKDGGLDSVQDCRAIYFKRS